MLNQKDQNDLENKIYEFVTKEGDTTLKTILDFGISSINGTTHSNGNGTGFLDELRRDQQNEEDIMLLVHRMIDKKRIVYTLDRKLRTNGKH